jgi:hypothetical protein
MRKDLDKAVSLRKSGMSYSDIKARLGVPKSTLSDWFRDQKWSNDITTEYVKRVGNSSAIRLVVLNTVKGNRLKKVYEEARQDALVDFNELKYHPLFMAGVMIYMTRGNKTSKSRISISSMEPRIIKIFSMFLEKVCGVKNIRIQLQLNSDFMREKEIRQYWIDKSGLKPEYFLKTVKIKSIKPSNKPYFGVCNIIVNSAYLKNKILFWIELMSDEIGNERYLSEDFNNMRV